MLESDELTVMELDGAPSDLRLDIEHRVDFLSAHPDRLDLLVREGRQCSVRSFDLAERELTEPLPIPHCVGQATTLADGRLIGGFPLSSPGDVPGDWEIVMIDPEDGSAAALTRNSEIDEHPYVSADGSRVVWSRRIGDWPDETDLELYRRVVCFADVPAR